MKHHSETSDLKWIIYIDFYMISRISKAKQFVWKDSITFNRTFDKMSCSFTFPITYALNYYENRDLSKGYGTGRLYVYPWRQHGFSNGCQLTDGSLASNYGLSAGYLHTLPRSFYTQNHHKNHTKRFKFSQKAYPKVHSPFSAI